MGLLPVLCKSIPPQIAIVVGAFCGIIDTQYLYFIPTNTPGGSVSGRAKARREALTNREYILFSRQQAGDCTFCPRHDGENIRGEHSKWGKKRAMHTWYTTGKGRKAPKTFREGYTYQNCGIDVIPAADRSYYVRFWNNGDWTNGLQYAECHNPKWVYPVHYRTKLN